MTRYFAYGAHECEESSCPAVRAGFEEVKDINKRSRYQRDVYDRYDKNVKAILNERKMKGIVKEDIAQRAWNLAKRECVYPSSVEFAESVEEKLGWE